MDGTSVVECTTFSLRSKAGMVADWNALALEANEAKASARRDIFIFGVDFLLQLFDWKNVMASDDPVCWPGIL